MIAAAITLLGASMVAPDVSEFFPLNPGDEYTYQETGGGINDVFIDTVGVPIEIKGAMATPIATKSDDGSIESAFYRIYEGKVLLVAFDPKAPLDPPYSIIEFKDRGSKWDYLGQTDLMGAKASLKLDGKSRLIGQKEVLGQKVEVLEVILDAIVVDDEASQQMNQPVGLKTKQTALYAKGIGLYEMKSEAQMGKQKSTRLRRLTKYKKSGE